MKESLKAKRKQLNVSNYCGLKNGKNEKPKRKKINAEIILSVNLLRSTFQKLWP